MGSYLVVADRTLGGQQLEDEVRSRLADGPARVYVVVPVPGDESPGEGGIIAGAPSSNLPMTDPAGAGDERAPDLRQSALNWLKEATTRFSSLGVQEVDGEVGDPDPLAAIAQALEAHGPFDEILVATPPRSVSKWVAMDVASRAERRFELPVVHVEEEAIAGDLE